jgi:dTDP-4-amino-4,6-dideoxygalactose transaminase
VVAAGINGKMSEISAAFGLLQLRRIDEALSKRAAIASQYRSLLASLTGIQCAGECAGLTANNAYFPILVGPEFGTERDAVYQKLRDEGIFTRRYFYPLISDFPMYRGLPSAARSNLPVAARIASQVLCLPIYPDLSADEVARTVAVIKRCGA